MSAPEPGVGEVVVDPDRAHWYRCPHGWATDGHGPDCTGDVAHATWAQVQTLFSDEYEPSGLDEFSPDRTTNPAT